MTHTHPLDPLTPGEISKVSSAIRATLPQNEPISFRTITLREPIKADLIPYLEAERLNTPLPPPPPRRAQAHFYIHDGFYESFVNLSSDPFDVETTLQDAKTHGMLDPTEMRMLETACLADERVQAEIKALNLPEGSEVAIDPWTYATDEFLDTTRRVELCYFYLRRGSSGLAYNHYSKPLDFYVAIYGGTEEILYVRQLPVRDNEQEKEAKAEQRKIFSDVDEEGNEYDPGLSGIPPRTDLKPLHVVQPEGPSFKNTGNLMEWQKWRFRVGFNYREGLVLHNVTYDGRNTFYRLSLSEMFIPYGDPRIPYTRKAAFDLGSNGAGNYTNSLELGCDCLGTIKYFDGWLSDSNGDPRQIKNAICCHEIDDGILWKHSQYKNNSVVVARSRKLVLQSIITVSNYEYAFQWIFDQAGAIHYEIKLTGIISTVPIAPGEKSAYGTVVGPNTLASVHQHLFSVRIDPAIDGHKNSVLVQETHPIDDASTDPFGVGIIQKSTILENETPADVDVSKNRIFKIINESTKNPRSGQHCGYQIIPHPSQMLLSKPSSFHTKRAAFAKHAFWFTKYHDGELYPAGNWTNESTGDAGLEVSINERNKSIKDDDVVVWHTVATTHHPRPEDWPVMPVETLRVMLKPVHFFKHNPGLDVPVSTKEKAAAETKSVCC